MNTVEETTTGVSPAEFILSHSIILSAHIMAPVVRVGEPANIALAERRTILSHMYGTYYTTVLL